MRENQNQVYHDYGKMYIDQMKGKNIPAVRKQWSGWRPIFMNISENRCP